MSTDLHCDTSLATDRLHHEYFMVAQDAFIEKTFNCVVHCVCYDFIRLQHNNQYTAAAYFNQYFIRA